MYILDSDVLGFYLNNPDNHPHLSKNIEDADAKGLLCTSIVTVEEVLAGRINHLRTAHVQKDEYSLLEAYRYLLEFVCEMPKFLILPFDEAAYAEFKGMPKPLIKGSVNDCRIAAIAISRDYIVVTNNRKDFSRIEAATSVKVEYWVNAPLS